jgi:ATP-dependent protease ClpP protease subunit
MKKIPFNISASTESQTALIRITGTIGWDTDCEIFRKQIDGISQQGITDAHLYLNGPGGSCFDAEEIVNIIQSVFTGKVTGEGGALVASAYTRIAMICSTFTMPENGMFMVHKPSGYINGTASRIESYLKLLKNTESQYLDLYTTKATDKAELTKQWNTGDWWMTAKEAKANGFITEVKEKAKIDAEATAMLVACGCPQDKIPTINNSKTEENMDLKTMAKSLGLPESATEAEINAKIEENKQAAKDLADLKAAQAQKAKDELTAKIKKDVDKAVAEKRITADNSQKWTDALHKDYEGNKALLDSLEVVEKIPHRQGAGAQGTTTKATHMGKAFEELQEENPEALADLMEKDPDAYDAIYDNYLVRKKLK